MADSWKRVMLGIIALWLMFAGTSLGGGIEGLIAIKAGHIVTVTGGVIEDGTVLIRDGIIEAVGDVEIPPGAEVIVEDTMYVYPGFIDAHGKIALAESEEKEKTASRGSSGRPSAAPSPLLCPEKQTADRLNPKDSKIEGVRNTGVTTVLTAPDRGVFIGLLALVPILVCSPRTGAPWGESVNSWSIFVSIRFSILLQITAILQRCQASGACAHLLCIL